MERPVMMQKVKEALADLAVETAEMPNDDALVIIRKEDLLPVLTVLKNDAELRFTSLMNQLGADLGDRFAVIYNLYSFALKRKITIKAFLDRGDPKIDSAEPVFRSANWFERETYDLLGIRFSGHSNLKRLLLPEDWEGHPLRKDYVFPQHYNGIDNRREPLCE